MLWLMVLGAIGAVIIAVLLIGWLLPQKHRASVSRDVPTPPDQVWRAITEVRTLPNWHPEVKQVESISDQNGKPTWREIYRNGDAIRFETVSAEPPGRLVRRIADPTLPYGGTWTIGIVATPSGSKVTITEDGEVYNPVFRFVSRFITGHTGTMERYLAALDQHLRSTSSEGVNPRPA
jgi:uncharacterized protein YndB with AHSA1/START domain